MTLTRVFVGQSAGNGEYWVEALEYDWVENHFAVARLNGQISQVMSEFGQILKLIQRINLLPGKT